jgi:hypothetical protein
VELISACLCGINGDGVTTALLKKNGIKVWNDQDYLCEKGVCISIESS